MALCPLQNQTGDVDNDAVAAVFAEMGDLLAIVGGDPHRARAFRNTARIIEGLRTPLKDMLIMGQLKKVRGLGDGSIERIQHILQTGTCAEHQKLLQRLPTGIRALLKLRGLGPRHARLAYEHLGISSIEQLEVAARSGMLSRVPGIGPLTVERVIRDLDAMKAAPPPRLPLREALAVGDALTRFMLEDGNTILAAQTGSARRRKESVGDLDILVASSRPALSSARFVTFAGVTDVLLAGDARASVILSSGVQADLRLVAAENWGAGLHYFTGSKPHNIAMRVRANAHKLALSEMGLWERKLMGRGRGDENRKIARRISACTDEREVFSLLGLPFIAPELREGDGEMDAAIAGKLPDLVDDAQLLGEAGLRARTRADAVACAHALGRRGQRWALWTRPWRDVADGAARRRFISDAARVGADSGVDVVAGVVVDVADLGGIAAADLDGLVVVADLGDASDGDADAQSAAVIDVVKSRRVHGVRRLMGRSDARPEGRALHHRAVLLACAQNGVFVEVDGGAVRPDLDARRCRVATEVGAILALTGSPGTARDVDDERAGLRLALWQARRGWATAPATLNALSPAHLRQVLHVAHAQVGGALTVDASDANDDSIDGGDAGAAEGDDDDVDPLLAPHRRLELMTRLSSFLQGDTDDAELLALLSRRGGNALQEAFALLSGLGDDDAADDYCYDYFYDG